MLVVSGCRLPPLLAVAPVSALTFELTTVAGGTGGLVATAGRWERAGETAMFMPRFAPTPGLEFAVVGRAEASLPWRDLARARVSGGRMAPSAVVTAVDPGGAEVPANLLRFSVTFSAEMEEGSAAGHLHLFDGKGVELQGALLEMPPELWDRERRRLTVLLEPGRVKRGLLPNVQAGAPVKQGDTVTFVVDPGLRASTGAELAAGASRTYRVGGAMRSRVEPVLWEVRWPPDHGGPLGHGGPLEHGGPPGRSGALVVVFDRPLDRALVERCLSVRGGDGHPVPGRATLSVDARQWEFSPEPRDAGLGAGATLHVDSRLEDLAGNSVRRMFDRDLDVTEDAPVDVNEVVLTRDGRVTRRP